MHDTKTYSGGCHCGKVRYEVTTALESLIECNCSYCSKKASLLTFVAPDAFKLLSGENELSEYRFNTHKIEHLSCKTCGVESYATGVGPDGKQMYAINARCLDDTDLGGVKTTKYDGKNR